MGIGRLSPVWRKIFVNTFYQIIGKGVTAGTTLVSTIIITRSLGVDLYGDFTKAFAFAGLFYMFGDFGLNAIYVKKAASGEDDFGIVDFISLRLVLSLFLVAVAILIGWRLPYNPVTAHGFSPEVKVAIAIASFSILTQTMYTTANGYFQAKLEYLYSTIALSVGSLVALLLVLVTSIAGGSLIFYAGSQVAGGAVMVVTANLFIASQTKFFLKFHFRKWLMTLREAAPIGISLVLNLVYFRFDTIILSSLRPSSEVGSYGLAYKIFEVSLVLPIFFTNAIYPVLVTEFKQSRGAFLKKAWYGFSFLLFAGFAVGLVLNLAASFLVSLIGGSQFTASVVPLKILSLGLPLFYTTAILMWILIILKRQILLVPAYALAAFANIVLNLIFIPQFGQLAAATTTVVTEGMILVVGLTLVLVYVQKRE